MGIAKAGGPQESAALVASLAVTPFGKKHPTLVEYLVATTYEDGSARQPSTLTVFIEDGVVKLCLNDRAEGRTGWVASVALEEALASLEKRLATGSVEWRKAWTPSGAKRGRGA